MAQSRGIKAIPCDTAKAAIEGADIVVTTIPLVPAPTPFLDANWMKAGSFATITDLAAPWLAETMPCFDRIVVDDLDQETKMSKPLVKPELVAGDLTGHVCSEVSGRQSAGERTCFVFRGLAVGDLAVAALAYVHAKATGALETSAAG